MSVTEDDLRMLEEFEQRGYHNGGFKIYDVSNPAQPKLICYQKTGGIGVHRFDMDERYAYISTEMKGYVGNILVIYDLRDPRRPQEVSRWWMTGQHIEGGETPTWSGRRHRLHHALRFGNEMWASCWHGGFWVVDVSDLGAAEKRRQLQLPSAVSGADPHGDAGAGSHPRPAHRACDRRGGPGAERERGGGAARARACVPADLRRQRSRRHQAARRSFRSASSNSPFSRTGGARFGAHQFCERMSGTIAYAVWFGGGLRIIDVADPLSPREIGHFIPEPVAGRAAPQSNDVALDERGLIYMVDRHVGFDILEFQG